MNANGYSADLQKVYRNSNWLESSGTGAMIRIGDLVPYEERPRRSSWVAAGEASSKGVFNAKHQICFSVGAFGGDYSTKADGLLPKCFLKLVLKYFGSENPTR